LRVVVSGGKGGVGATTVAVNLTVALVRQGQRAVLVDADFAQPDATALCGISDGDTVADVLNGRRTVHEVLQRGPAGIQVLPGAWAPKQLPECSPLAQQRMLTELARLGPHADVVVLDVGSGLDPLVGRFWQSADVVLLVTTCDAASIMDAYASIKVLTADQSDCRVCTLVNQSDSEAAAADVHARIAQACSRFLGKSIHPAGRLPLDPKIAAATRAQQPFLLRSPECDAAPRLETLVEDLMQDAFGQDKRKVAA
jgi:flagellar biosynthesis protein FlhG